MFVFFFFLSLGKLDKWKAVSLAERVRTHPGVYMNSVY